MLLGTLLDLLAPPACLACGAPGPGAAPLCGGCRRALRFLDPDAVCPRCALPRPCGDRRGRCPAATAPWDRAWAPVAYDGPAAALVAALKVRSAPGCARLMAAQLAATAPVAARCEDGAVLVPVPTHPARVRRRGYDQVVVLAQALARRTGAPVARPLRRGGARARQLGAGRAERLQAGRLGLTCPGPAPRRVLLVDDVHTTGATLAAAARALRLAGAEQVDAVTWARTLRSGT